MHLWAEQSDADWNALSEKNQHTGTVTQEDLRTLLEGIGVFQGLESEPASGRIALRLPVRVSPDGRASPLPSTRLAHRMGVGGAGETDGQSGETAAVQTVIELRAVTVETVTIGGLDAEIVLSRLEDLAAHSRGMLKQSAQSAEDVQSGDSVIFFSSVARFARGLMAEQRVVPMLIRSEDGTLRAAWQPWVSDAGVRGRLGSMLRSMPKQARAVQDGFEHAGWDVVVSFMGMIIDASCRDALVNEGMGSALQSRKTKAGDPHVAWLGGLLDDEDGVAGAADPAAMMRLVRGWVGGLEERGISSEWSLLLRLNEPIVFENDEGDEEGGALFSTVDDRLWSVTFHLRSQENPGIVVDAEDLWAVRGNVLTVQGLRIDDPQELLLKEIARASRLWPELEAALEEAEPSLIELHTDSAYAFLRELGPLLEEQGFVIESPQWWDTPEARLGGRLKIISDDADPLGGALQTPGAVETSRLGLNALVSYEWSLAVGDTPLTLKEFEELASANVPLVQIRGQWVELRPEDVEAAAQFIRDHPGGEMRLGEALRLAFGGGMGDSGLSVLGIDATGWAGALLDDMGDQRMPLIDTPNGFAGELRPYQQKGLSWLVFLDRIGLGPCLADDMGLGKTIQLLALLLYEREQVTLAREAGEDVESIGPTLLVVPMSIVGNWTREANKFAPQLKVLLHHGADRHGEDSFTSEAESCDLVVTTYALANRDQELFSEVAWHRVVLDEAQNIKNPAAKQSKAVRDLASDRRIALTGTPLENRLSELWSIMDFCNPGLLGSSGQFRRAFSVPIERHHDKGKAQHLRSMVRPFILRRLKTDPSVITDLPEKIESKEFCRLTPEQASLYESTVKDMLSEVERSEGIRRRGVVLTTLIRLKQICDHPALVDHVGKSSKQEPTELETVETLGEAADIGLLEASRSGKCVRLIEMLEEVLDSNEQALVFTQFRQMGHLLSSMLRHTFDREVLFLHGGVSQKQRERMVERFQQGDGSTPVFLLSLKAGGVGLNLTAASHVFHFDRWWNPAVENQATDRAFRIGQDKRVNVHKFIVGGTLEERIDQMIESKVALAEDIIGSGEDWLTELSTGQLQDVLSLRVESGEEE